MARSSKAFVDAGVAIALCGLIGCSEAAAPGIDSDRVRAELAQVGTALAAEPLAGLAALTGRMQAALSAAGPTPPGALFPPGADGMRFTYAPGTMAYLPAAGGTDGEVSFELYRIVPTTILPELPLTMTGAVRLVQGPVGAIRVTSLEPGFSLRWTRSSGASGLELEGEFSPGSPRLTFTALLPPAGADMVRASIEIVNPATGLRYSYRQVVPLGEETALVDISVDHGASLRLFGSYTVRGPDLTVTIAGVTAARVTLTSRLDVIVTPVAGRMLSASEESVIRQTESLTGPVSAFLTVLAFPAGS
ncbi:MAG: hypothetical protein AB7I33_06700 [Gemmatimonadales bacterium]